MKLETLEIEPGIAIVVKPGMQSNILNEIKSEIERQ